MDRHENELLSGTYPIRVDLNLCKIIDRHFGLSLKIYGRSITHGLVVRSLCKGILWTVIKHKKGWCFVSVKKNIKLPERPFEERRSSSVTNP